MITKMKFLAFVAMLAVVSCGKTEKGYTITGTVEGAKDGSMVYLEIIDGEDAQRIDSVAIKNESFVLKGVQDSIAVRYLSCDDSKDVYSTAFFLENGNITYSVKGGKESVTGTPLNDKYQKIRSEAQSWLDKMNEVYAILDTEQLSEEEQEAKMHEIDAIEKAHTDVLKKAMYENIENPIGVFLFKNSFFENSLAENDALFNKIPAKFRNDAYLQGLQELIKVQKATDVNAPYKDFEMKDLNGKSVKLSDYIDKGKVILVDFWASWCGPCRQAFPELTKLYEKYNGKFEIVGVSLDDKEDAWKKAYEHHGLKWPQMSDLKGWKSEAVLLYGITAIPHTLLIDNNGTIVARNLHGEYLEEKLKELID